MRRGTALLILALAAAALRAEDRVAAVMESFSEAGRVIESAVRTETADDEAAAAAAESLARSYVELGELYDPRFGPSGESWRARCAEGAAGVERLNEAIRSGRWADARAEWAGLSALRGRAHREFRPGLFKKFLRFFGGR